MTRLYAALVIAALAFGGGYWTRGSIEARKTLDAAEAARDARERADRAETARLAAQAERDALQRELEAAAHDTPVRHPDALGADRVRRLQQIR